MSTLAELVLIAVGSAIVNNVVLSQFLGICPFLGVSKKTETAAGMGGAVIFVITLSSFITGLIYKFILANPFLVKKGIDLTYLLEAGDTVHRRQNANHLNLLWRDRHLFLGFAQSGGIFPYGIPRDTRTACDIRTADKFSTSRLKQSEYSFFCTHIIYLHRNYGIFCLQHLRLQPCRLSRR